MVQSSDDGDGALTVPSCIFHHALPPMPMRAHLVAANHPVHLASCPPVTTPSRRRRRRQSVLNSGVADGSVLDLGMPNNSLP